MRHLHLAELRDSWTAWLSVALTFIAVNAVFALFALFESATRHASATGILDSDGLDTLLAQSYLNYVLGGIVGMLVIGSVTALVIASRRGSIARLQLGGASPAQVTATLMSQLAVVSVVAGVIGDIVGALLVQPALNEETKTQQLPHVAAVPAIWPVLAANLACVVVSLVGGLRVARQATRIPPVEALRQAQVAPRTGRGLWWRVPVALLLIGLVALIFMASRFANKIDDQKSALQMVMQMTFAIIPLCAIAVTVLAPLTIGMFTRGWTALIPSGVSSTWHLARNTVLGKMGRLVRSVVPIMLTMGLLFAMTTLGNSFQATLDAMGSGVQLAGSDMTSLLVPMGGALGIALAGSLSALLMMARQRESELALDGVLGATPAQRIWIPVLEATIIVVTSLVMALAMLAVEVAYMRSALPLIMSSYKVVVPWGAIGLLTLAILAITIAATLLPTLRSLRTPEPRIIGRYVAA